ncbi:hypothetical protein GJ496_006529 [Pomphorhynchus laevis]|nr:hypothetical protein GJ496_006529 [Pomphorhynchus laevis]
MLTESKSFKSDDDAIRAVQRKSIYLNHVRVLNPDTVLCLGEHVMPGMFTLLSIGKRNHMLINWTSLASDSKDQHDVV